MSSTLHKQSVPELGLETSISLPPESPSAMPSAPWSGEPSSLPTAGWAQRGILKDHGRGKTSHPYPPKAVLLTNRLGSKELLEVHLFEKSRAVF